MIGDTSGRVSGARLRARTRHDRQRSFLRPVGWALAVVVCSGATAAHPAAGLRGVGAGVTAALVVYVAALAAWMSGRWLGRGEASQAGVIAVMGAAAVALTALQPRGPAGVAGGAAVWAALARLPLRLGAPLAVAITVALAAASALRGSAASLVLAQTLLCLLFGLMAHFMRESRESQDRTELLLAELEDARDAEARAAAVAERTRIAGELHDVLAHTLSGAAVQLQGARMLAARERSQPQVAAAVERASELVRDGLADARRAVRALRGEDLPSIEQLDRLVASFCDDMKADVSLTIEGSARPLAAEASLALYRGAQEALTNAVRYAPGAATSVVLRYGAKRTILSVEDRGAAGGAASDGLAGAGGGHGLAGMRERLERAGGTMQAGPTPHGWRVELEVPV